MDSDSDLYLDSELDPFNGICPFMATFDSCADVPDAWRGTGDSSLLPVKIQLNGMEFFDVPNASRLSTYIGYLNKTDVFSIEDLFITPETLKYLRMNSEQLLHLSPSTAIFPKFTATMRDALFDLKRDDHDQLKGDGQPGDWRMFESSTAFAGLGLQVMLGLKMFRGLKTHKQILEYLKHTSAQFVNETICQSTDSGGDPTEESGMFISVGANVLRLQNNRITGLDVTEPLSSLEERFDYLCDAIKGNRLLHRAIVVSTCDLGELLNNAGYSRLFQCAQENKVLIDVTTTSFTSLTLFGKATHIGYALC